MDRGCENCGDQIGCSSDGLNWLCEWCMELKEKKMDEEEYLA